MGKYKQLTTEKEIYQKIEQLKGIDNGLSLLLGSAKASTLLMALIFSADCAECGQHQDLIKTGRLELLNGIAGVTELQKAIQEMTRLLHPNASELNKDALRNTDPDLYE